MVPITLQGGEPSMLKGWLNLINGLDPDFYVDILTNLDFDIDEFMGAIPPDRLQRDVPYASIRVSYHRKESPPIDLLDNLVKMRNADYSVGVFAVDHPGFSNRDFEQWCRRLDIDFRTKEFLGIYEGVLWGLYRYPDALDGTPKKVRCKMTELLIAPDGNIHRCHRDLYAGENSLGNILDEDLRIEFKFRKCDRYGECNPCDVKVKNDRFQKFGSCSIEIKSQN